MRENKPSVSVIIPTKNRAGDLETTVATLVTQSRVPSELIIVDQSGQPSFKKQVNLPVVYIHDPSLTGLTAARNAAMDVAKGDIWLFLDDDVVLEPTFIEEIIAAYRPDVTGVSGIITNYERPTAAHRAWESVFVRGPFRDERQSVYWNANRLRDSLPVRVRHLGGGLMSFRADAIRAFRFDTRLTGPCPGEDIEFCARLPHGSVLLIAPKARLVHKRSPEARDSSHWSHWLSLHAQVSSYLRECHWKRGPLDSLCYLWLTIGYGAAATVSSMRRASSDPWHAWRRGIRQGVAIARRKIPRPALGDPNSAVADLR